LGVEIKRRLAGGNGGGFDLADYSLVGIRTDLSWCVFSS
jgi:hypothetical protein